MLAIQQKKKKTILWLVPSILALLAVIYAIFSIIMSGVLPTLYIVILSVFSALVLLLIFFLAIKQFKRRQLVARIFSVILSVITIATIVFGLYALNRGLGAVDGMTTDKNAVQVDTSKSFNVFISGIDSYGDISTKSRSDVNILATVNPDTRNILLTTIPRDAYVKIPLGGNNQYDKLTHAGIYGVEASMGSVANLLDTKVDAYVRINFTSFIESIDGIGGVTINNPTAFTSYGESFPAGEITLDGKRALVYSRERKNLAAGDIDRGKNQARVIQGVVDKISSSSSLGEYNSFLDILSDSVQTNLSSGTIRALINQQLANPGSWSTEQNTLTGKGQTGGLKSYAMPNAELYMYVLNEQSVADAKKQIVNHMNARP